MVVLTGHVDLRKLSLRVRHVIAGLYELIFVHRGHVTRRNRVPKVCLRQGTFHQGRVQVRFHAILFVRQGRQGPSLRFLQGRMVFVLTRAPCVPPIKDVSNRHVSFSARRQRRNRRRIFQERQVDVRQFNVQTRRLSTRAIRINVRRRHVSQHTSATASRRLSPLCSFLRLLKVEIVRRRGVPLLHAQEYRPVVTRGQAGERARPMTPLISRGPLSLVGEVFRPKEEGCADHRGRNPRRPCNRRHRTNHSRPPPSKLSFIRELFGKVRGLGRAIPTGLSIGPTAVLIRQRPSGGEFARGVIFQRRTPRA